MQEENVIRSFIVWWNNTFPIDVWYRRKHKIRFNSKEHRETAFLDMMIEWEEENAFTDYRNRQHDLKEQKYYEDTGEWLRPREDEDQSINQFFEGLDDDDWDDFDDD